MKTLNQLILGFAIALCCASSAAADQAAVSARPTMVLKQIIEGMPSGDKQ
jgi:hypothetical protein